MPLELVPRSARAFSAHLNRYYRVLKGIDQESVAFRLANGGAFQVRHSVTQEPILEVTDAGLTYAVSGSDLINGSVTTEKLAPDAVDSSKIADGAIVNADVNAAAGVVVSKLAAGGTANRVVATVDGTAMALQQIVGNMIADNTIPSSKLTGASVPAGSITTTEIADGTIQNVDVNAAAAIVLTKLAHVGTGNVLRSNGTNNVAGQIVSGDITDATIVSADLALAAATQVVAAVPTTSYPTATASMTDMPEMSVTLTTLGRPVLILFSAAIYSSVNNAGANFEVHTDGVLSTSFSDSMGIATLFTQATYFAVLTPSAAAHTFKVRWQNPGAGTLTNSAISRQLIAVEFRR